MGWVQVSLDGVIIVCQALKKADISSYLQDRAEAFLKEQARAITVTTFERWVLFQTAESKAKQNAATEFDKIFKHQNFQALLNTFLAELNRTVIVPLVEALEAYRGDARLYAIPKYIMDFYICRAVRELLEKSDAGLAQIWNDVFDNQNAARWDEIKSTFIEFVSTTSAEQAINSFDQIMIPQTKRRMTGRRYLAIKTIPRPPASIFFGV